MSFHSQSSRHGGGRPWHGGGPRRDFRGPRDGGRPNRGPNAPEPPAGHTAVQPGLEALLGGRRFPHCESASLRLDKFVTIGNKLKLREIRDAVALHNRRKPVAPGFVPHRDFETFAAVLRSSLIVNQAGGILENAGISLHPHFDVPFLPGSAVKGIARHAAWLEWAAEEDEPKKRDIADRIAKTFGYPTGDGRPQEGPFRSKQNAYLDNYLAERGWKNKTAAGTVIFMGAFPCDAHGNPAPASLAVDILTPHGGNDWTDPVPNPFPVVAKGTFFKFAVGPAGPTGGGCVPDALRWLKKGLAEEGLGAKTAAGYGAFRILGDPIPSAVKSYTLRLVTPAFLRGAECDEGKLREASLRGVLRYWWRILFGSVLNKADLAKLETQIWGGPGKPPSASQIAIRLVPLRPSAILPFDKEPLARKLPVAFQSKRFDKRQGRNVVTAPGLAYASYGMDDSGRRRAVLHPGAEWRLELSFRPRGGMAPEILATHAELALKALCTFGGIGSRSRKGFGSLDCGMALDVGDKSGLSALLGDALAPFGLACNGDGAGDYSFLAHDLPPPLSVSIATADPWAAIDRIGFALQTVASSLKHRGEKAAAGLPRKIHGPLDHPLGHQHGRWNPPEKLRPDTPELRGATRFASPLFVHVSPGANGNLEVNAIAFPSGLVRPQAVSRDILGRYLGALRDVLSQTRW